MSRTLVIEPEAEHELESALTATHFRDSGSSPE